jgi:hypothetical protein
MKKTEAILIAAVISIILGLWLSHVCAAPQSKAKAGTYCVDVGNDSTRVEEAFGSILNLGRPATTAEVESALFDWVEGQTHDYERRQNMASFTPAPFANNPVYHVSSPTATPKKK